MHDLFLRELSFPASGPELLAQVRQMAALQLVEGSNRPSLFASRANLKQLVRAVAHRNRSSSLRPLAVGHKNDWATPVKIPGTLLEAKFSFVGLLTAVIGDRS